MRRNLILLGVLPYIGELTMKKFALLICLAAFVSCVETPAEIELPKYSIDDLIPLNDSTRSLYYNDAAYIEFRQLIQDSTKRYDQIKLQEQNIISHYEDLLNIYNNSYSISNSFFENISSIHTFDAYTLHHLHASVDTNKVWVEEWLNGSAYTGIVGIDSLIKNYDIEVSFSYESSGGYNFTLKTQMPINYFALKTKLEKTGEFRYVAPDIIIGGGRGIYLVGGNQKLYEYILAWGDCPSGCIYSHYWEIEVTNQKIILLKEYGDPLP